MHTRRKFLYGFLPSALAVIFSAPAHAGYNLNLLATFTQPNEFSNAGVAFGPNGILYGTTQGNNGFQGLYGTVYSVSNGAAAPLVSFTGTTGQYLGNQPTASLTMASDGTYYGTTLKGGTSDSGTVFSYKPGADVPFHSLYSFGGSDGANPYSALTLSADGSTLYGTTQNGGTNGDGTVFSLGTNGSTFSTLTSFSGVNGANPYGGLLLSGSILYGTTNSGGNLSLNNGRGDGAVFSLSTSGGSPNVLATLGTANSFPRSGLTLVGNTLYGTTLQGGNLSLNNGRGWGSVFSLDVGGGVVSTLVGFTANSGAALGASPYAGLTLGKDGILYGATEGGGNGSGTAFSYAPGNGVNGSGGTFSSIYSFTNSANGVNPYGNLTFGPDGTTLYGTTNGGGHLTGYGTVFSLSAAPEPSDWAALAFTGLGIGGLLLRARRRLSK